LAQASFFLSFEEEIKNTILFTFLKKKRP